MSDKKQIIEQTNLAFDFIQRLYLEVSYLIKEVEGILRDEEQRFVIGRPGGYQITARSSLSLESSGVDLWLYRRFAVFFVPEDKTQPQSGVTTTKIDEDLKILYLRIVLNDKSVDQPVVYPGVLYNIVPQPSAKPFQKFEHAMTHLEYQAHKVFANPKTIAYGDGRIKVQGKLLKENLFDINNSEMIMKKIVKPSLELYTKH